jgi:MFS transporter, ACS family, hexuronate transporter
MPPEIPMPAALRIEQRSRLKLRHLRWYMAGLLVLATTLSYLDRQVLAVIMGGTSLSLSKEDYSLIQDAFLLSLAVMQPVGGWIIDWLGTRRGDALAVLFWSLANMAHAFATGVQSFASLRFLLGVGEAGNYPGVMKAIAAWFPARERGLATGIFNIGSSLGTILALPLVATIVPCLGWQAAFVVAGALGLIWVVLWLVFYREPGQHPLLTSAEFDLITCGELPASCVPGAHPPRPAEPVAAARARWSEVLRYKEIWAVMLAKLLTDPGWYFYLFWLPPYLHDAHRFDLKSIATFAWMPYVSAGVGSVLGGVLSTVFSRWGLSILGARKLALCLCAVMTPVAIPAGYTQNAYLALAFICVATFVHQCWSANLLVIPADLLPQRIVGSACGLAGMAGIIGAGLFTPFVGFMLKSVGYGTIFTIVGFLYPVAAILFLLLVGKRAQNGPGAFPVTTVGVN